MAYTRPLPPACRCCTNQTSIFGECDNAKIGSYTLLTLQRGTHRRRRDSVVNRETRLYRLSFEQTGRYMVEQVELYAGEEKVSWINTRLYKKTYKTNMLTHRHFGCCSIILNNQTTSLIHTKNISTNAQVAFHCGACLHKDRNFDPWPSMIL